MLLYGTITSERASKGQGGNKSITTSLCVGSVEDSREVAQIILTAHKDNTYTIELFDSEAEGTPSKWKHGTLSLELARLEVATKQKGKREKGEMCLKCGEPIDGHYVHFNC